MIIKARFNGPPGSGNGGYTAGLLAARVCAVPVQVTLRVPPPLDTPLRVIAADGGVAAYADQTLVAEAVPRRLDGGPVAPVSFDDAVAAAARYAGFVDHPFPTCYVCGPKRAPGDGLRIFPGPCGDGRTAAPWLVPPEVSAVTMWAALDCPGGWSIIGPGRPYVLGRITARVDQVASAGEQCLVVGAVESTEGRKARVASAVYGSHGALLAQARATWIAT